jgi:release factor glutamine methyltransferase
VTPPAASTVGDLLEESTKRLAEAGVPEARREAMALLAHALGVDRGGVLARRPDAVSAEALAAMQGMLSARAERRPLQHLTGRVEFDGLTFEVGPAVLIPRPETEGLVEAIVAWGLPEQAHVVDLGTGSGCIAIALAARRPAWKLTAVERSSEALVVARRNASRQGVDGRITFVPGDFEEAARRGPFDAVVSNPPYVPEEEWRTLAPEVRDHEPKQALVPGPTGLEAYEAIAPLAQATLGPAGLLALELGWTSEAGVRRIVGRAGFSDVRVLPDLAGIPRVLLARR